MKLAVRTVFNQAVALVVMFIILWAVGDVASGRVEKMGYFGAVSNFTAFLGLATLVKWGIGFGGDRLGLPFLGPTLKLGAIPYRLELLLFFIAVLILPLTGDVGARL